jgi:hypothetical protein
LLLEIGEDTERFQDWGWDWDQLWMIWRDSLVEVVGWQQKKQSKEKLGETPALLGERKQKGIKEEFADGSEIW